MKILNAILIVCTTILILSCSQTNKAPLSEIEKRSWDHALTHIQLTDDLEASLFAHEPWVVNPTNIDIDHKGRIWVCEGYNYRNQLNPFNPENPEGDRIVILEDTDQDGKADIHKIFYQGTDVNSALGIAVLGNKVYVSCSPYMFVFTDQDGDDLPDQRDTLFTEVGGVQHDHALHAVTFGPDGKLYFNFGNEGKQLLGSNGEVLYDKMGNAIEANGKPYREGMVFRCNEDGSEVEVLAHNFRNNYEVAVDSYGTLWQSDNDDDGNRGVRINYVMEYGNYGYKDQMTGEGWRARRTGMAEDIPTRHWHQNDPGVIPNLLQTGAGSPTGIILYEGSLLPQRYHNQMIHCDAGPRVVRAYPVEPKDAGFSATIDTIMVSTDDFWFRPADVCVAPDGSLIVADWYDPGVGGHKVEDLERGRLFRIAPKADAYEIPTFDYQSAEGAVKALQNPNLSVRYLAWHALNKMGTQAEEALLTLWKQENPVFQARAFWLLVRIPQKTQHYLEKGLQHDDPNIRITALRAARQMDEANILSHVAKLINDPHAHVRREAAIALRFEHNEKGAEMWTQLAQQYQGNDRWYLEALGIGADLHADLYFNTWLEAVGDKWKDPNNQDIVWRMRAEAATPLLADLIRSQDQPEQMHRYFRAFDFHNEGKKEAVLEAFFDNPPAQHTADIQQLALSHVSSQSLRQSPKVQQALSQTLASISDPTDYLYLIGKHIHYLPQSILSAQLPQLKDMILQSEDADHQATAMNLVLDIPQGKSWVTDQLKGENPLLKKRMLLTLGMAQDQEAMTILEQVIADARVSHTDRQAAIQALGNGWTGSHRLMELLEAGEIPQELEKSAANKLMTAWDGTLRKAALKYLPESQGKDTPLSPIDQLVQKTGNSANGAQIFETHCGTCHQVNGKGINFGPNLSEIGNKLSKEALYAAILHPSAGINFGYEAYLIKTVSDNIYSGYIESEDASTLTLRMPGGFSQPIPKEQIASMEEMSQSLMPEGLHQTMTEQELIDLVDYLTQLKQSTLAAK